ncbi:MAG: LCP family protein, partial [Lachnospiraceae bacterium]|nr:LCP family protein [Lachnospiraceae bacterium]
MQEYDNNKNSNIRRMPTGERQPRPNRPQRPDGAQRAGGQTRPVGQMRPNGTGRANGQARPAGQQRTTGAPRPGGQARPTGQAKPAGQMRPDGTGRPNRQAGPTGQPRRQGVDGQQRPIGQQKPAGQQRTAAQQRANTRPEPGQRRQKPQANGNLKKNPKNLSPQQAAKKKRRKIVMFVAEIFLLLILVGTLWAVKKAQKIQYVDIKREDVFINEAVIDKIDQGTSNMKGYRNIALFGVDSRDQELDKNTRTDVIMIASINQDTKKVKLISVYRDTWLNMTNDKYSKANAAYAKGGSKQAIGMLNMNLDLDITDFVTVGFEAVIKTVDAVGGVEINVTEEE